MRRRCASTFSKQRRELFKSVESGAPDGASDGSRTDRRFVAVMLVLGCAFSVLALMRFAQLASQDRTTFASDFQFFHVAAQKLGRGETEEIYSAESAREYYAGTGAALGYRPFVHPPAALLAVWPLGHLSRRDAAFACFGGHLAFLAAALALLPTGWLRKLRETPWRGAAAFAALACPSCVVAIMFGQLGILTAALLIGACCRRGRAVLGGCCLGVLIAIKPPLGVIAPIALVAAREWRALAAMSVTAAFLCVVAASLWGWRLWPEWLAVAAMHATLIERGPGDILAMMASWYAAFRQFGLAHDLALALQAIIAVGTVGIVIRAFAESGITAESAALLLAATFVASPYVFLYDLPALILPLAVLANRGLSGNWRAQERVAFVACLLMPLVAPQLQELRAPVAAVGNLWLVVILSRLARADD